MERPCTSKPRGICRFYTTPRGCFAGKSCKFLHGEDEKLTLFDKNKICKFYRAGYCHRGADCWFRHVDDSESSSLPVSRDSPDEDLCCSVCYEKPVTYALLSGCSHVFCLPCIKRWRKSFYRKYDVSFETARLCPYCRVSSKFITPSSHFFPEGHPRKAEIVAQYKESMARVPCRYFQKSSPTNRHCRFGRDCFYQHLNEDGTPCIFTRGAEDTMNPLPFEWTQFMHLEDIGVTLSAIQNLHSIIGLPDDDQADRLLHLAEEMLQNLSGIQNGYGRGDPTLHDTGRLRSTTPMEYSDQTHSERELHTEVQELHETPTSSQPIQELPSFDANLTDTTLDTSSPTNLTTNVTISPSTLETSVIISGSLESGEDPIQRVEHDTIVDDNDARSQMQTYAGDTSVVPVSSSAEEGIIQSEDSTPMIDPDGETSPAAFVESPSRTTPLYHNPNPLFATDGRGRVVWSNRSGRDAQSGQLGRPSLGRKVHPEESDVMVQPSSTLASSQSRSEVHGDLDGDQSFITTVITTGIPQ